MSVAVSQATLKRANRWKLAGLVALLVMLFVVLIAVENLLVSSILALMISYSLGPLVNYLERQGIGRTLATTFVFVSVGIVISLVGLWLFPYFGETVSRLQNDMPRFITGVAQFISELESRVQDFSGPLTNFDLESRIEAQLTSWTRDLFTGLPAFLKTFMTVILLGPFLAFFMLIV